MALVGLGAAVPKYYFEDFNTSWTAEYGPRHVTREEIIGFAAQFDPQPMHLDEEAARNTMLGGLGASGWHSCCIMMKMIADGLLLVVPGIGHGGPGHPPLAGAQGQPVLAWRQPSLRCFLSG